MKEISTEIIIHGSPQTIWTILMELGEYPHWNPFILSIKGDIIVGKKIEVRLHPPGGSAMTFKPNVLVADANKEFRWLGHLLFPGLFDGEHKFELTDNGNGTTTFRQSEVFKGILVPLFAKMLDQNTTAGFHQMNQKLKERAEQR